MLKKIPIGVSDFKKLITDNCYFVDKSLLIKEVIDDGSEVVLIPRPRRFGKTLNLSMIRYFFDINEQENLFENLSIWQDEEYQKYKGVYPVVFLTFKDTKAESYEDCLKKIKKIIFELLEDFRYIFDSPKVSPRYKEELKGLYEGTASDVDYESVLKVLMRCLNEHYGKKVLLLIDEYDVPMQSGYSNGYYDRIIGFMRNFLSEGLKDSPYLYKGVMTGILRLAKEGIFSGLNNLQVATIIDTPYSQRFGLEESEVKEILLYYGKEDKLDVVRQWYNGYAFGKTTIYNPWSVLNYIKNDRDEGHPYWINTASNDIVKDLIKRGDPNIKEDMEILMNDGEIIKEINSNIVMTEIEKSSSSVWNFLLFSGYLKPVGRVEKSGSYRIFYSLKIPNTEVMYLFETIITSWFQETVKGNDFDIMLKSLLEGDIELFQEIFSKYCVSAFSYFDTADESEKTYHAFVLGMLVSLSKEKYIVKSNRESGYGRYDVMIIPKDKSQNGIIMEFKKLSKQRKETMKKALESAFKQMEEKNYRQELLDLGIDSIYEVAIAVDGKRSLSEGRKV